MRLNFIVWKGDRRKNDECARREEREGKRKREKGKSKDKNRER